MIYDFGVDKTKKKYWDMALFCRGWPKMQYIGQTGLKLTAICLSAESTGENHYIWL